MLSGLAGMIPGRTCVSRFLSTNGVVAMTKQMLDPRAGRADLAALPLRWPSGKIVVALAAAAVSGCAGYRPVPLTPYETTPVQSLTVPAGTLLPGGLETHPLSVDDGLDPTEVAMLAVVRSPDLQVIRAQAKVSHAQAFAAGLLPDPVLGLTRDRPNGGQPGASTASTHGVSWDVGSLIAYAARTTARRRSDEQVDLALLWAEWQTVAGSRLQFGRIQTGRALVARLEAEERAIAPLAPRLNAALARGVVAFDVATTGLSAASDVARQLTEARDALAAREQDLRELIGLAPDAELPLVGEVRLAPMDDAAVAAALETLPQCRPDLRALKLGYAAQEARVRAAILGQFPAVNVGITRNRDNTGISSQGIALSVSLPLFDGNRGAVRVERATREQLHAEYAQRMLTARGDVSRLMVTQRLLAQREQTLAPYSVDLEATAARAARAYDAGTLDWTVYVGIRQSALSAATELLNLRENLAETRIGLATLLSGRWITRDTRDQGNGT